MLKEGDHIIMVSFVAAVTLIFAQFAQGLTLDRFAQVANYDVSDSTHDHVVDLLRKYAGKNDEPLYIAVERTVRPPMEEKEVEITFDGVGANEDVGLRLVSTKGEAGNMEGPHIVAEIMKGTAAHRAGELQPGDQILNVNGEDVSGMVHEQVWTLATDNAR